MTFRMFVLLNSNLHSSSILLWKNLTPNLTLTLTNRVNTIRSQFDIFPLRPQSK